MYVPVFLAFLAQGYAQLGHMQDALATITEAIHLSETTLAAFWQAEAYRVKGELSRFNRKGKRQKAKIKKSKVPNPKSQILDPQSPKPKRVS